MKSIILSLISLAILSSCGTTYRLQYAELSSANTSVKDGSFVFSNDSVKIVYSFWGDRGPMQFSIYNELNVPIYIDWNKSSLIMNDHKFGYWIDKTETTGGGNFKSSAFKSYGFYFPSITTTGSSNSYSTAIKDERVSFIPPKSYIFIDKFELVPIDDFTIAKSTDKKDKRESTIDYKSAKFKVRNYITYSLKEDITNERSVDNEFYISKVGEFNEHFASEPAEKMNIVTKNLKQSPTSFYILIPVNKE